MKSKSRLWLERLGIVLVAVVALGTPFVFGFVFYLAVRPAGVFFNEDDPLRVTHIWMQRERGGASGIGLQTTSTSAGAGGLQCARTRITFLRWRPALEIELGGGSCTCYQTQNGKLAATKAVCE
jgi:hypothetical protein